MITIYQGETGGTVDIDYDPAIGAISGYAYLVGRQRETFRYEGTVLSGVLSIPKSSISGLDPLVYSILPQVVDGLGLVYFLTPDDLKVAEVPPPSE